MTIEKKQSGNELVVALEGRLDTMTAPELHGELNNLDLPQNVRLDLSRTEYISSAGLREIVGLYRSVSAKGGSLSVYGVMPAVMDVFRLTGFDKKFEIIPA